MYTDRVPVVYGIHGAEEAERWGEKARSYRKVVYWKRFTANGRSKGNH